MEVLEKLVTITNNNRVTTTTTLICLPIIYALLRRVVATKNNRLKSIPKKEERVLIIGGSSGVGRKIAHVYAKRHARVCIIGRRESQLEEVRKECLGFYTMITKKEGSRSRENRGSSESSILALTADMNKAEDLVTIRERLQKEWAGLDTLHICAGVSALRPLLDVAGSPYGREETSVEGIKTVAEVAQKALNGNFIGPLMVAVTFIPQLQATSQSPSILLISTVASLIPAPTRSLYGSTKSASLMLFRSLAIEHPKINFSYLCPGTIEGNFRASAVDGGDVREVLKGALTVNEVGRRCVRMVDKGEGVVLIPFKYSLGIWVSWFFPWYTSKVARKKYDYDYVYDH